MSISKNTRIMASEIPALLQFQTVKKILEGFRPSAEIFSNESNRRDAACKFAYKTVPIVSRETMRSKFDFPINLEPASGNSCKKHQFYCFSIYNMI